MFLPCRDLLNEISSPSGAPSFNPVLGFCSVATGELCDVDRVGETFQSRSRFLPHRGHRRARRDRTRGGSFNPILGFYLIATRRAARAGHARDDVSIPFWVSTSSRPTMTFVAAELTSRFQSRSGFLPHRDLDSGCHNKPSPHVSIPFWVSTPSRLGSSFVANPMPPEFQSRSGFLPHRDRAEDTAADRADRAFQSRSGFLPHRDSSVHPCGRASRFVSIPFWVSTSSRHDWNGLHNR